MHEMQSERTPPGVVARRAVSLFGVAVDPLTFAETVDRIEALVDAGVPVQHVVLNASKVVQMHEDAELRRIITDCDLVNADGMSVVWASRLLGAPLPERVTGADLFPAALQLAQRRGWPVYLLGARHDVLEQVLVRVRREYPELVIAGSRDGYFDPSDTAVADAIAATGARLLFVGMPSPRKERWLAEHLERTGVTFAMGVGGTFDIWAGVSRRAPEWAQRAGLEWLYRFAQEPRRMWRRYLVGNTRFLLLVAREALRR